MNSHEIAYIQPTEFYQLLLLSSSSVFQSAAVPGWTLKNTSTAASSVRKRHSLFPARFIGNAPKEPATYRAH